MVKVAIITRTMNRPMLLRRAAESVMGQSLDDYVWVIVNDGDPGVVDEIVSGFPEDKLLVIHNPMPVGMEAASNMGIKSSDSEYVVIHDDDDSWHPDFLRRTTGYLDAPGPSDVRQGVITYSEVVREEIRGNSIIIKNRYPFNAELACLSLYGMLANNKFPPISFLYRRKVIEEIGHYDETLPVLGDWEFNIRFMMKYDIGLIPHVLAYYHQRQGAYSNSIVNGSGQHLLYDNLLRNRYLRKDIRAGAIGAGYYMNIGRNFETVQVSLGTVESMMLKLRNPLKTIAKKLRGG